MDTPARTALKTQARWTSATLTRAAVHLAGLFPLAELAYHAAAQQLTVNPIQFIEQFFGLAALNLLALSLAVTPLITLTGYKTLGRHSRALGLYTFLYFSLHLLVFIGLDYSFDFSEILRLTAEKPFILAGAAAGLLLTALALMRDARPGQPLRYRYVDVGRVRQYEYQAAAATETVQVGDLSYDALRVYRTNGGNDETILWIANGVPTPVRILQREDGEDAIDLRLTEYQGA